MASPTSAAAVANAFLDIQDQDTSDFPRIDQMKIQKLVYYAQAWWLALNDGRPLFDDKINAWPWGPVVSNVYGSFRQFGRQPIVGERATEIRRIGSGPLNFRLAVPPAPNEEVMDHLRNVWASHKSFTGIQLSNASHNPGEPWSIVKDQYGNLDGKPVIPNDLIKEVFQSRLG